jgi:medium-chain acyl-[acyl-carrier-protein] hydrolase
MNNGKYILVAEEYLPEDFKTESIRVEYKKAAVLGDLLYPEVYTQQNGVTIVLADAQKVPYAIIQFRGK